ncbi:MAG: M42 family metallopeptidase [Deltaproteobacteria bacterium]|nr:M42 family metallopeptidase [Deltaproteobacteria bacterium]
MNKESKDFLFDLLATPSPTGYEERIQRLVRDHMKRYSDDTTVDLHGNLVVALNRSAKRRVMLAGHCDQIGFIVKHISKEGFIYVGSLGGIDLGVILGAQVVIHSKQGPVPGVIGRKPIHHQTGEERSTVKTDIDKVWIDIGARNQKEVLKKIEIGDPITFKPEVLQLGKDLICGPGLDNRVGCFVAMEALKLCARSKLAVGLFAVSTVQEEVGLRGAHTAAYGIDPEVGIAIDVTHATDNPGNENPRAVPIKLGGGPAISKGPSVNSVVARMLTETAKKLKIAYQPEPSSRLLGNDATAIQIARAGVASASIGIPNRYMHTQVEVCNINDLENAAKLLAAFIKGINNKTDFRPI